jgi:hypothetical protein
MGCWCTPHHPYGDVTHKTKGHILPAHAFYHINSELTRWQQEATKPWGKNHFQLVIVRLTF